MLRNYRCLLNSHLIHFELSKKYMKELGVLTKRRNGLVTADQQAIAIDVVAQEDPLGRWGGRLNLGKDPYT